MAANGKAKGSASRDFLTSKPIAFIGCDSHSRGAVDGVRLKSERKKLFDNKTPSPGLKMMEPLFYISGVFLSENVIDRRL